MLREGVLSGVPATERCDMNKTQNSQTNASKKTPKRQGRGSRPEGGQNPVRNTVAGRRAHNNVRAALRAVPIPDQVAREGMLLCRHMAIPSTRPSLRLPTPDMSQTAVAAFRYTDSVTVSPDLIPSGFEKGGMTFVMYGQPALTYMNGPILVSANTSYVLRFGADDALTYASDAIVPTVTASFNADMDLWLPVSSLAHLYGDEHKGAVVSVGRANGINFFFMTKGEKIVLSLAVPTIAGSNNGYDLQFFFFNGPNIDNSLAGEYGVTSATTVGTVLFEAPRDGHYAIKLTRVGVVGTSSGGTGQGPLIGLNLFTAAGSGVWDLHRTPDACGPTGDKFIGQRVRRTAFSLLVTNTTNMITKQGNVVAGRMRAETANNITEAALSAVADRYTGPAAKGAYSYMDFTREAEEFVDAVEGTNGQSFVYDLTRSDLIHVIRFDGLALSPTEVKPSLLVTCDIALEFVTDSQRYERTVSPHSNLALIEARRINNSTSYFYENPLHPEDIMRYLAKAWSALRSQSTNIARGVSAAYPQVAPVAMPLGRLLQT